MHGLQGHDQVWRERQKQTGLQAEEVSLSEHLGLESNHLKGDLQMTCRWIETSLIPLGGSSYSIFIRSEGEKRYSVESTIINTIR